MAYSVEDFAAELADGAPQFSKAALEYLQTKPGATLQDVMMVMKKPVKRKGGKKC